MIYDAVIIGGGAAGLFCALTAGRRGRRVVVLEHNAQVGRKILISGGGRCNFTNRSVTADNFISQNPHFCRSALAGFGPDDFLALVKKHRIQFYEKTPGQLFCRDNSRQIVDMLLDECRQSRVEIRTGIKVQKVSSGENYIIDTSSGKIESHSVVVACGGLSFPKIGATGFGYDIARQFGHTIVATRPSLVALTLKGKRFPHLSGISLDVNVDAGKHIFRENILFTHRGLSGPAILQASNYWSRDRELSIDLLPDNDLSDFLKSYPHPKRKTGNVLAEILPQRAVQALLSPTIAEKPLDILSKKDIGSLTAQIHDWKVSFDGTEGYDRAEVTLGGVSTKDISGKTMESKLIKGLYFIGEVIDVTGWLGGYNFQWAWSSGYAAGNSL